MSVALASVTAVELQDATLWSAELALFREQVDDARWTGLLSLREEARSTDTETEDVEAREGVLGSVTDDTEAAAEFALTDRLESVTECKEEMEERTEEGCWVGVLWEEVREEERVSGEVTALSAWLF